MKKLQADIRKTTGRNDVSWQFLADNLPHLTASLNAIAIVLLAIGLYRIKHGQARKHKNVMLAAVAVSMVFSGLLSAP